MLQIEQVTAVRDHSSQGGGDRLVRHSLNFDLYVTHEWVKPLVSTSSRTASYVCLLVRDGHRLVGVARSCGLPRQ
ncbi:MAG: hypothetical protein U0231_18880 [Nitrospiraceae bacterium]